MRGWQRAQRAQRDGAPADTLAAKDGDGAGGADRAACTLLGTVGWYFQGVAIAYNCGMSDIGCGTTAKLWLAADGIGVWILAMTAAILPIVSRGRPRWAAACRRHVLGSAARGRQLVPSRRTPNMTHS
jgi:type IV secretory pathway TrbD component